MSLNAIAERYARAIFELGVETNQLKRLSDDIDTFARAYVESAELRAVLDNPLVHPEKREAVLKDIGARIGAAELTLNAVRLLAQRHRTSALPLIARGLRSLADEQAGLLRVTVVSATTLSEAYLKELEQALEGALGRRIFLERRQDPSLIGGIVTQFGDNTIDGSLKGRLHELERRLLQTA
jgi:F-type H+-transporting ATPase subunit delta